MTLIILVLTLFELDWISVQNLRVLASIACFSLIIKFYDWLKLFESTSFFISLIGFTFRDITWFMILFAVALIAFAVPMSMLDLNRNGDEVLIGTSFGWWFIDGIINQYLLSLGEFASLETMGESPDTTRLAMAFFILSTGFTSVTMLNMLIAIMGDSFAYATENKDKFATMTKLEILIALAPTLNQ